MTTQTKRPKDSISITVEPDLIAVVDEVRKENNTTRSGVISKCLEEFAQRRITKLMEEGYRAMAKEHKQFAKLSAEAAEEVVPAWKQLRHNGVRY